MARAAGREQGPSASPEQAVGSVGTPRTDDIPVPRTISLAGLQTNARQVGGILASH